MNSLFIFSLGVAFVLATSAEAQIHVQLEVHNDKAEMRAELQTAKAKGENAEVVGGLDSIDPHSFYITIKLSGDDVADTKFARPVLKTAVDDTGRDLVDHDHGFPELFDELGFFGGLKRVGGGLIVDLETFLGETAPQARMIKELSGEVELFLPKHDPDSIVKVEDFQKLGGMPMVSPLLSAAGIELHTLIRKQLYSLGSFWPSVFITLQIKDPNRKLVGLEFQDAGGHKINVRALSGDPSGPAGQTNDYGFDSKLPETARLVIYLATPKSLIKVPFSFKNISLPWAMGK